MLPERLAAVVAVVYWSMGQRVEVLPQGPSNRSHSSDSKSINDRSQGWVKLNVRDCPSPADLATTTPGKLALSPIWC
jgi:hypothetical protein